MTNPRVSIVIPSRNEEADLYKTIEACLKIKYLDKEITVVDDSSDNTPILVMKYANQGVRLIQRSENLNGCCGARNLGMQLADGDIIVLFNADNLPEPDFIHRILKHYQDGADYVIVQSRVKNRENIWGKFTHASALAFPNPDPEWSEGFSCRRSAVEKSGYIPGNFPIPFCRDFMLGLGLKKAGYKKKIDHEIVVEHVVPSSLSGYWRNQVWRGTFSAPFTYYFRNLPVWLILLREMTKAIRTFLRYLIAIPVLNDTYKRQKMIQGNLLDFLQLLFAGGVQDLATVVGNFMGVKNLIKQLIPV